MPEFLVFVYHKKTKKFASRGNRTPVNALEEHHFTTKL